MEKCFPCSERGKFNYMGVSFHETDDELKECIVAAGIPNSGMHEATLIGFSHNAK